MPHNTCTHPPEGLINPAPAVKFNGRVVRWRFDCPCGESVVLDTKTGENASERSADVREHGPNLPPAS